MYMGDPGLALMQGLSATAARKAWDKFLLRLRDGLDGRQQASGGLGHGGVSVKSIGTV
jgi:hypothetical protein